MVLQCVVALCDSLFLNYVINVLVVGFVELMELLFSLTGFACFFVRYSVQYRRRFSSFYDRAIMELTQSPPSKAYGISTHRTDHDLDHLDAVSVIMVC